MAGVDAGGAGVKRGVEGSRIISTTPSPSNDKAALGVIGCRSRLGVRPAPASGVWTAAQIRHHVRVGGALVVLEPGVEQLDKHVHQLGFAIITLCPQDAKTAQERVVGGAMLVEPWVPRRGHPVLLVIEVSADGLDDLIEDARKRIPTDTAGMGGPQAADHVRDVAVLLNDSDRWEPRSVVHASTVRDVHGKREPKPPALNRARVNTTVPPATGSPNLVYVSPSWIRAPAPSSKPLPKL